MTTALMAAATLWLTLPDGAQPLAVQPAAAVSASCEVSSRALVVTVDPARARQPVEGFGAAMTESSAMVLDRLPADARRAALEDLFTAKGLGLSFLRVPIGSSDFSDGDYSCEDVPGRFDLARCTHRVLPYIREARRLNPRLKLLGTAWSAPAWMKTNGSMRNGALKAANHQAYADYLVRFAAGMRDAGAPLSYLTPGNEPLYGTDGYPSMVMASTEEARFIGLALGPALEKAGLWPGLKVLAYDHNWLHPEYPLAVLADPAAARYAAGTAFHCYEGEPKAMDSVAAAFPGKELHFTECSAGGWEKRFPNALQWAAKTLVVGNLRHGARSVMLWNLALDGDGGPTNHGCLDCRGVITVARSSDSYSRSPEYWALAHAARAASPGARVVASTATGTSTGLSEVAVLNPDGTLGLVAVSEGARDVPVVVRAPGGCLSYTHPAGAVATLRWPAP